MFCLSKAIENVFAIGKEYPLNTSGSSYDCICKPPFDYDDTTNSTGWASLGRENCAVRVSIILLALINFFIFAANEWNTDRSRLRKKCLRIRRVSYVHHIIFGNIHDFCDTQGFQECTIFPVKSATSYQRFLNFNRHFVDELLRLHNKCSNA